MQRGNIVDLGKRVRIKSVDIRDCQEGLMIDVFYNYVFINKIMAKYLTVFRRKTLLEDVDCIDEGKVRSFADEECIRDHLGWQLDI